MSKLKPWHYLAFGLGAGLILAVSWGIFGNRDTVAPTVNGNLSLNSDQNANQGLDANSNTAPLTDTSFFSTNDLPDRDRNFDFSASLPTGWAVEYVPGSRAVSIFDPQAEGDTTLEKSRIFVTYFEASDFLTLSTVDIASQEETTTNDRPTVVYTIEKKSEVEDFADQPSWRNREHQVTDIRTTDDSPTIFYAFAKSPDVPDAVFQSFLESVRFTSVAPVSSVVYPMTEFTSRITKKNFGQYITPQNSPVQPERFSGYHAGVDAEILDGEADRDVPVYAMADGTVRLVQAVNGYGGVIMIEHQVDGQTVTALYGHIRLASVLKPTGQSVRKAEQVAVLGTGGSSETDGQRKHLHFAILKGQSSNLRGYVSSSGALSEWEDPVAWLSVHSASDPTA